MILHDLGLICTNESVKSFQILILPSKLKILKFLWVQKAWRFNLGNYVHCIAILQRYDLKKYEKVQILF
jgi:hypothetical protein